MSEICGIGEEASITAVKVTEEKLTARETEDLIKSAEEDIASEKLDDALQKIKRLISFYALWKPIVDRSICGYISRNILRWGYPLVGKSIIMLVCKLCAADCTYVEELISLLRRTPGFSIDAAHRRGREYEIAIPKQNIAYGLYIPIETDKETANFLHKLHQLLWERDFKALERDLPRLAELSAADRVNQEEFFYFCKRLVEENCSFAWEYLPLFERDYNIIRESNTIYIVDKKVPQYCNISFTSATFSFLDCDAMLEAIAKKPQRVVRVVMYVALAHHQYRRASEVMEMAEKEVDQADFVLDKIDLRLHLLRYYGRNDKKRAKHAASIIESDLTQFPDNLLLETFWFRLLNYYMLHDKASFVRLAADIERQLLATTSSEDNKYQFLACISLLRARRAFLQNRYRECDQWLSKAKEYAREVCEPKSLKLFQSELSNLQKDRAALLLEKGGAVAQKV